MVDRGETKDEVVNILLRLGRMIPTGDQGARVRRQSAKAGAGEPVRELGWRDVREIPFISRPSPSPSVAGSWRRERYVVWVGAKIQETI